MCAVPLFILPLYTQECWNVNTNMGPNCSRSLYGNAIVCAVGVSVMLMRTGNTCVMGTMHYIYASQLHKLHWHTSSIHTSSLIGVLECKCHLGSQLHTYSKLQFNLLTCFVFFFSVMLIHTVRTYVRRIMTSICIIN